MKKTLLLTVAASLLLISGNAKAESSLSELTVPAEYTSFVSSLDERGMEDYTYVKSTLESGLTKLAEEYTSVSKEYDRLLEEEIAKIKADEVKTEEEKTKEIEEKTKFLQNGKDEELALIKKDLDEAKEKAQEGFNSFLEKEVIIRSR